jgi:hypothetical protein
MSYESFCQQMYSRARICTRLWSPGIDSKESIPPAYVACGPVRQIGFSNRPNRLGIDFWAPEKKGLQIRALLVCYIANLFTTEAVD